ncbi:jacalin-related lectin 2-like [Capsicum chacoense]
MTNKGSYGPYGSNRIADSKFHQLKEFTIQIGDDRSFGGFYGTKTDRYIESIGIYIKLITSSMMQTRSKRRGSIN